jgi:hypothetical protein
LVRVLRRLRRLVAAGPSGLTNDHILHMFPTKTDADIAGLDPLLAFVNKALAGDLCDATVDFLTVSTLVALYKPDGEGGLKKVDGKLDVRPIAMPETLYRIASLMRPRASQGPGCCPPPQVAAVRRQRAVWC